MQNKKFKILLNISIILLLTGFIFCFIKLPIGLLFIFTFLIFGVILNIKYPNEIKEFRENANQKQIKTHAGNSDYNFFNVEHISGIESAKLNQKCEITVTTKELSFYDKKDNFMAAFDYSEIKNCVLYQEIEQKYKDKSPVCRVITGGILLGSMGAVIGGISSLTPEIQENKKYYLEIDVPELDDSVFIAGKIKDLQEIKRIITERV